MRSRFLVAAAVALCATSFTARADTSTFNFSFGTSANTFSGSGTFTATSTTTAGEYQVIGITGTAFTTKNSTKPISISMLLAPGTFPTQTNGGTTPSNDNLLFFPEVNGGYFDFKGVSFELTNGAQINLYYQLGGPNDAGLLRRSGSLLISENVTETVTPTPEPDSFLLLGTGLMGLGGVLRRHAKV